MADIEPTFTTYDGDDPDGYALAVNVQRRSLTKGQRAMIAAQAEAQDFSGKNLEDIDASQISKARLILRFAPELAAGVVAGESLNDAYAIAAQRKKEAAELARQHATRVSDTFRRIVGRILSTYHTDELRADVIAHYTDSLGDAMPAEREGIDPSSVRIGPVDLGPDDRKPLTSTNT